MDHYITEFRLQRGERQVKDYAVFLEKKQGLAALNPFGMSRQLVIYITDRGCYWLVVQGMGEFSEARPLRPEDLLLTDGGSMVRSVRDDRLYRFARKFSNGTASSIGEFALALQESTR